MTKINILDDLTIQKIAAGEVIEKPASVVKELVENSIDANSDSIIIEVINGGKSFIRITDNGDGMEEEDLSIAFLKHSTSKLKSIDDLFSIMSLGFRGEALSSISSVSKVEVLTKTGASNSGLRAFLEEGKIQSMETVGSPKGTTMIIRDLFYNLPVRKKFLKTDLSEGNSVGDIVNKLALGNPHVSFKLIRDNKTILQTSQNQSLLDNIYNILGRDTAKSLIPIEYSSSRFKLSGYISNTSLYRGNRNHQYLYINGRFVVNSAISKIIENQYKSLIPINRFPIYILYLEIDPLEIDVNIHPTKQEVKFLNNDFVYGKISNIIKEHLLSSISVPKFIIDSGVKEEKKIPNIFDIDIPNKYEDILVYDFTKEKNIDNSLSKIEDKEKQILFHEPSEEFHNLNEDIFGLDEVQFTNSFESFEPIELLDTKADDYKPNDYKIDNIIIEEQKIEDILFDIKPIGRIFDTYIIAESKVDEVLILIDQHAAHERIMYEKYKKEFENEEVNKQMLMFSEIIELTNSEMTSLQSNIDLFNKLGFDIDEFGHNSIALRSVPIIFGAPNTRDLFMDILDNLDSGIKSNYDTRVEKIMKIACTNAIKSGDDIKEPEIMALVMDLKACDNPYTCPHGRPTIVEISKKDIEKQFLRII